MNLSAESIAKQPEGLYYFVTIKKVGKNTYTTPELLSRKLDFILTGYKYCIMDLSDELDSSNTLHRHVLIKVYGGHFFIRSQRGWTFDCQKVDSSVESLNKVEQYIYKRAHNQFEQSEIHTLNDSRNLCLFDQI